MPASRIDIHRRPHGAAGRRRSRAALAAFTALVASALLFMLAASLLGCSDLGHFDERKVSRQAERYMQDKYGIETETVSVWEDRTYALFGYSSLDRAFCRMQDGSWVIVPFGDRAGDPLKDNKQARQICTEVYETAFRDAATNTATALGEAGYRVDGVFFNNRDLSQLDASDIVAEETWGDESEYSDNFFHTRYDGDPEAFLAEEREATLFQVIYVEYVISGNDADYPDNYPTDVPQTSAWQPPLQDLASRLYEISSDALFADIRASQSGYATATKPESIGGYALNDAGLLGELECNGAEQHWLIVDWVYAGHGIWITSDTPGIRLSSDDIALTVVDPPDLARLDIGESFGDESGKTIDPSILEAYQITVSDDFRARHQEDLEYGWFSARIAYDNADPACGLSPGTAVTSTSPSLYLLEKVEADASASASGESGSGDAEDWRYELNGLRQDPLPNGWQNSSLTIVLDSPALYVRL